MLAAALVLDDMVSPYDIEQDAMQSSEELYELESEPELDEVEFIPVEDSTEPVLGLVLLSDDVLFGPDRFVQVY